MFRERQISHQSGVGLPPGATATGETATGERTGAAIETTASAGSERTAAATTSERKRRR